MEEYVWIIDDDQSIRWVLEKALKQAGMQVSSFETADEALETERGNIIRPNAIISDIRMPGSDGITFLAHYKEKHPDTPILIMTAYSDLESTVTSFEQGAFEYISKPFDVDNVVAQIRKACNANTTPGRSSVQSPSKNEAIQELLGDAPAMQEVFKAIGRLARSKMTVLINGESGSGKELIAQALHRHSPRSEKPFVALNMAAIPHDLMESELFGHEKGAFTGASATRTGRFEQANRGTLFLDEIGDMPSTLQTRLLRVLADGQFYKVGGHTPIQVDVRIVAATHQNLEQLVEEKIFREDLFHRLNVIRIHAPSLRERTEDIPLLMRRFLDNAAAELDVESKLTTPAFDDYISKLEWRGNVRQLQNTAHWLTVMAAGTELQITDLPAELGGPSQSSNHTDDYHTDDWESSFKHWVNKELCNEKTNILGTATPAMERILIECALNKTGNRRQKAAKLLGWGRNTLTRKIKELDITPR